MHYVNWAQGLPRVLLRRLYAAMQGFNEHDGLSMAAATAYYFALSLFPLMLILVAGLGIVLRTTAVGQDARTKVLQFIEQQASPELADQIGRALEVVSDRAAATGPIGFLVLLVTAILIFTQIDYSFQRIWGVTGKSHHGRLDWLWRLVSRRLRAVVMLLAAGAFVFLGTVASLVWSTAQSHLARAFEILPDDGWAFSLAMNVGLNFVAFALIYRFVPAANVRWRDALQGACVAAILWEIGRQVLEVYLVRQSYPTAYGVIGSFMAIMLWAYYATIVVYYGAEYTRVVGQEHEHGKATTG